MEENIKNNDKMDSVAFKRNAKGEASWDIKRYYDQEKTSHDEILKDIKKNSKE